MRRAKDAQGSLDFQPATRAETEEYYELLRRGLKYCTDRALTDKQA